MRIIIATLTALLLFAGSASAGEAKERGAYIGGALGTTTFDDDGAFNYIDATFDDEDSGVQIWGGYKFLPWLAVEGKLAYLGEFTLSDDFATVSAEASAVTVNVVFILPFGKSGWDIYGQLGIGALGYEVDTGCCGSDDDSEFVGAAGAGVRWTPIIPLTLSLGIDAYAWAEDSGYYDSYTPSIAITKLGIQYNF